MESNTPFLLADGVAHLEPRAVSILSSSSSSSFLKKVAPFFLEKLRYIDGESSYILEIFFSLKSSSFPSALFVKGISEKWYTIKINNSM